MSKIDDVLNDIMNARYGKDVRQALYDGIKACYEEYNNVRDGIIEEIEQKGEETIATIPEEYSQLQADVDGVEESIKKINVLEEIIITEKLTENSVYTTSGTFLEFDSWYSTDYLDVSELNNVKSVFTTPYHTIYSISYWTEDKNFISGTRAKVDLTSLMEFDVDIPDNAKYYRICGMKASYIKPIYILQYINVSKLKSIVEDSIVNVDDLYEKINLNSENILDIKNIFLSVIFQNILCIGDSLTEGDYGSYPEGTVNLHEKNYPYFLSKITNAKVTNAGSSGASASSYFKNNLKEINTEEKYDCIYIFLGTNGGLTDTIDSDTSTGDYNTYTNQTGKYCAIIEWCKEKFPDSKLFLINLPYNSRAESWTEMINDIIEKIGEKYNVPVIDIMRRSPFTRENGQIYRPVGYDENLEPYGNLHFGTLGYLTLANCIVEITSDIVKNNMIEYAIV